MSHHGREYEDDRDVCGVACSVNAQLAATFRPFVLLLADSDSELDPIWVREEAERRLIAAGLPTRAHRLAAQAKARRAEQLDAEIERLRAERSKL